MNLLVPNIHPDESNRAYARRVLRMNIMTFRIEPGTPLNEKDLAAALHMSRTPIHEALAQLSNENLVDIYPQRGTSVSRIDPGLVKEGYSARLLLEGALLRDEAGKIGRSQIQPIMQCMRQLESLRDELPQRVDEFIQLDDELHRLMYYFGGRSYTWNSIRGLVSHYDRMRYLDAMEGNADYETVFRQHREMCDYLLMGMPENVSPEQKVNEHLASYRGNLMEKMERYPGYFILEP